MLGSLHRAGRDRSLEDNLFGIEMLAKDHARPLGEVHIDGGHEIRLLAPWRRVVGDGLVAGDHPANMDDRRHRRDQVLRGRERGLQGGLSHHAAVDDDRVVVHRRVRRKEEVGAGVETGAGFDADDAALAQNTIHVVNGSRHRQVDLAPGHDLREHIVLHRHHAEGRQIAWGAHAGSGRPTRVGELRVRQMEIGCAFVHLGHEGIDRAGIPARCRLGEVVRGRNQHPFQDLEERQLLPDLDLHDRLLVAQVRFVRAHVGVADRDVRTRLALLQLAVLEHDERGHHLGHARGRSGLLVARARHQTEPTDADRSRSAQRPGQGRRGAGHDLSAVKQVRGGYSGDRTQVVDRRQGDYDHHDDDPSPPPHPRKTLTESAPHRLRQANPQVGEESQRGDEEADRMR